MKKALALLALTATLAGTHASAAGVTVTIACGAQGQEFQMCQEGADRWMKKTGNTVKLYQAPNLTNDRLALYQEQLAAKSSDIDVYQIDVIWPGLLGQHFVDLKGKVPESELAAHFKGSIAADTVGGKLTALPWYIDAGLMYYRTDLLKKYGYSAPPKTWAELATMAKKIQDGEQKTNKQFAGFVFQGKNYEGLTCNALEWVYSSGGGTIVDTSGKVTINNPKAAKALDDAAKWVGTISPQGVSTYDEEPGRGIFQAGNAAFLRSWPYVWALAQGKESKVAGKVGVAPLPTSGGPSAATLGGWQLAVSSYSKNQTAAIELVRYLASPEEQKIRAIKASYNPTITALYQDKEVLTANPFFISLSKVFTGTVARPSTPTKGKYNQVSQAFSTAVSDVLRGKMTGQAAVAKLQTDLSRLKGTGW